MVGGGLTWLVLSETRRREQDLEERDLADEAIWLEERLAEEGRPVAPDTIERVVQLHREYLAVVPPSDGADEWPPDELVATSEEAWQTVGWEGPAAGSHEGEPPPPDRPPPERTAPDEQGVRHEAGGG